MTKRIKIMRTVEAIHLDAKHKIDDLNIVLGALRAKQSCSQKHNISLDKAIYKIITEVNYQKDLMDIIEEHLL